VKTRVETYRGYLIICFQSTEWFANISRPSSNRQCSVARTLQPVCKKGSKSY